MSLSILALLCVVMSATAVVIPADYRRELHTSGRHLMHMHIEAAQVYGNSSEMMYFYSDVYVGDFANPSKQSLIIDTGSGLT